MGWCACKESKLHISIRLAVILFFLMQSFYAFSPASKFIFSLLVNSKHTVTHSVIPCRDGSLLQSKMYSTYREIIMSKTFKRW